MNFHFVWNLLAFLVVLNLLLTIPLPISLNKPKAEAEAEEDSNDSLHLPPSSEEVLCAVV
jgi:hypothetical protein